jgi:Flp pilus assembly protein TadG
MTLPIKSRATRTSSPRRGVAAVECAIVTPLLTLLVLGAIDVGQYANVYQKVSDASREGVRCAVQYDTLTSSQVETVVMNYLQDVFPNVPPSTLASATHVTITNSAGVTVSGDMTSAASGSQVDVTVSLQFEPIRWISHLPFLNGSDVAITTTMRRE